jgi:hypothetical protein
VCAGLCTLLCTEVDKVHHSRNICGTFVRGICDGGQMRS